MTETHRFRGSIRFWKPEEQRGLAVVDVPPDIAAALGGLKQFKVHGTVNGEGFASNTMPAGGGRLAMSVSRKMLDAAGLQVGDEADFEVERTPPA
jgi:hypothetical protein